MGAGLIGSDFATAMKGLSKEEHEIVAVGASSIQKAEEFAKKFGIKHAFEGYEKIATCPEVDVVYVNVINTNHLECVKMALNAGKPVLCEKPLALNLKQVQELTQLARQKGVFLMEGFWSQCFPIYKDIRQALKDQKIGQPILLQANFGYKFEPEELPRIFEKKTGGGVLIDMGCYTVMFATMIFNGQKPETVHAVGRLNEKGVDTTGCVTLKYPNGAVAQLTCSAEAELEKKAWVYGTKGKLEVQPSFYCPNEMNINSKTAKHPLPDIPGPYNFARSEGLSYEAQHVRECRLKGLKESPLVPLDYSETITSITDQMRHQIRVVYPQDPK